MKRATLTDLMAAASADTIRANPGLALPTRLDSPRTAPDALAVSTPAKPPKRATGQKNRAPRPATKAEAEWIAMLRQRFPHATIAPHCMTLAFPDGDRYTPDVLMAFDHGNFAVILYEVKARYRGPGWEQGMERFKRAKMAFPWVDLRLAEKHDGVWYLDGKRWTVTELQEG